MSDLVERITEKKVRSIIGESQRFVVARWQCLPVHHDILRKETFVYTEHLEGHYNIQGHCFKFIQLPALPTEEEAKLIEWRVVDLMNNFKYSHTPIGDACDDLARAVHEEILDIGILSSMASKYGSEETKQIVSSIP
jgi:hypothetical protein